MASTPPTPSFDLYLANPRGFCAGVTRAIEVVNQAVDMFDAPIYVKHEVVHNTHVVASLKARGVRFIEDIDQVPKGAILIFSAHGVSQAFRDAATRKGHTVFDATCPLVTKVHMEVKRYSDRGRDVILIGHANHPEVIGTLGQFKSTTNNIYLVQNSDEATRIQPSQPNNLAYVTQTTLSIDDTQNILTILKDRFPAILAPVKSDICYATQNRQDAVKKLTELMPTGGMVVIIGSPTSSNSNRLVELALAKGIPAHLIESAAEFKQEWLSSISTVGVSAGASAPEHLVEELMDTLIGYGGTVKPFTSGFSETVEFSLPKLSAIIK